MHSGSKSAKTSKEPMQNYLIIDAHQDIAWNMLTFGRDYTRSVGETRQLEQGTSSPKHNGDTLLGWDAYQQGHVAVIFSTLFASPQRWNEGEWDILCYQDIQQAHQLYRAQIDLYHRLVEEHPDKFTLIRTRGELNALLEINTLPANGEPRDQPIGLVLLMECADGVRHPTELEEWWALGVRLIGPAWAGTRYCGGTKEPGPLTKEGYALLDVMADLGFCLDLSHMDEKAALQALDHFPGNLMATHANAKALLKGTESNRHLSDPVILSIIERQGVIGVVPYNNFLRVGWKRGHARQLVPLQIVADQIDYICQLAGDARHAGIGSDFDGGFGLQSVPEGIDTIADLQKLSSLLANKGYQSTEIAAVMGGNWANFLKRALPETV